MTAANAVHAARAALERAPRKRGIAIRLGVYWYHAEACTRPRGQHGPAMLHHTRPTETGYETGTDVYCTCGCLANVWGASK